MRRVFPLAAIVGLVALAPASPAGAAKRCPPPSLPFTHWIDAAAPKAFDRLGVFRRPATRADSLPAGSWVRTGGLLGLAGAFQRGVRRVHTDLPGGPYYAIPGRLRGTFSDCPTARLGFQVVARRGGYMGAGVAGLGSLSSGVVGTFEQHAGSARQVGPTFVTGYVPDGVVRVVANYPYRDARRVVARVSDNLVWWRLAHHSAPSSFPRKITWIGRGGKILKVIKPKR